MAHWIQGSLQRNVFIKERWPLWTLTVVSLSWTFYYLSHSAWNDFGQSRQEWMLLIDGLIVVPLVAYFCSNETGIHRLIKPAVYASLMVLLGSLVIPESEKHVWQWLEYARYVVLFALVFIECITVYTLIVSLRSINPANGDLDEQLQAIIQARFGDSVISRMIALEVRMWQFFFSARSKQPEDYRGTQYFSYHHKDGAHSNQLGFVIMIGFELPIVHLLLHFMASPTIATVVTVLTVFSLVFFIAEYKAMAKRWISMDDQYLYIRYGLFNTVTLSRDAISHVRQNNNKMPRQKGVRRFNYSGTPNVEIICINEQGQSEKIVIGIDHPKRFIDALLTPKTDKPNCLALR